MKPSRSRFRSIWNQDRDVYGPGDNDGDNLASIIQPPIFDSAIYQRNFLRRRLHVLHDCSVHPSNNRRWYPPALDPLPPTPYTNLRTDLHTFKNERANGLYGPLPFMIANLLIGTPCLFLISIIFSVIAYWLSNFRPTAEAFFTRVLWLFLDLLAAEGLVVLITCLTPVFVVALAVTAFANGLWMAVGGFLVPPGTLNVFWKCKSTISCGDRLLLKSLQMCSIVSTIKRTSFRG